MAPPMSASGFLDALRAEGVTVVEVGDWQNHNRNHKGPWGPVHGVVIHQRRPRGTTARWPSAGTATRLSRARCATA